MKNIAVLASGNGSNFQAIAEAVKRGKIKAKLKLLVSDNPRAYAIERAVKAGVKVFIADWRDFASRKDFEEQIVRKLKSEKIGLVVLAGFMRVLSPYFVRQYQNKILNIHPALLPAFKGARAIEDAFKRGVKVTGVTVHFVDEEVDHGPIILQEALKIYEKDTLRSLEQRVHRLEHKLYPLALRLALFQHRGAA